MSCLAQRWIAPSSSEVGRMPYSWPKETDFALWELEVLDRSCAVCGRNMHVCDHRYRRIHTLEGPVQLLCKLDHCPDHKCPGHTRTKSPELEITIALPQVAIAWDVLCWIGHRRCSRHWSVAEIQGELADSYGIQLSDDSLTRYIQRYQVLLAARQQDPVTLQQQYKGSEQIILSIDGLQPEKGHETLYVVRELTQKRVWFAEPLLSATADEVRRLLIQAKEWAARLDKTVALWLSDRQDAFVTGIAAVFPGVPHRYCANHFLRDVAKPVLEADSHAKVQMRKKVRGLRTIEQAVLKHERSAEETAATAETAAAVPPASAANTSSAAAPTAAVALATAAPDPASANAVVLEYCAAVRGIVNDDQGGPLQPPGLRMAAALVEVRDSLQRNLDEKKGGSQRSNCAASRTASTAASTLSTTSKKRCAATSRTSRR